MFAEFQQDNIFETMRLQIRKLTMLDFAAFHEMQGNLNVMKYVANSENTEEEDRKDLKDVIKRYTQADNDLWVWAIVEKVKSEMVGTVALVKDREGNWEIGYRYLEKYWGNGYGTETVNGLIEFCNNINGIDSLIAYADLRNVGSQRVLSKCGFVNLGIKYNDDAESEDYIYSIRTSD